MTKKKSWNGADLSLQISNSLSYFFPYICYLLLSLLSFVINKGDIKSVSISFLIFDKIPGSIFFYVCRLVPLFRTNSASILYCCNSWYYSSKNKKIPLFVLSKLKVDAALHQNVIIRWTSYLDFICPLST